MAVSAEIDRGPPALVQPPGRRLGVRHDAAGQDRQQIGRRQRHAAQRAQHVARVGMAQHPLVAGQQQHRRPGRARQHECRRTERRHALQAHRAGPVEAGNHAPPQPLISCAARERQFAR